MVPGAKTLSVASKLFFNSHRWITKIDLFHFSVIILHVDLTFVAWVYAAHRLVEHNAAALIFSHFF